MKKSEILGDLYDVGKTKALGYLPLETIREYGDSIENILDYANKNYLKSVLLNYPEECDILSGALYLFDEAMLLKFLHKYTNVLKQANVPCSNCLAYKYIAEVFVDNRYYPEAYKVIGLTFNDGRFNEG